MRPLLTLMLCLLIAPLSNAFQNDYPTALEERFRIGLYCLNLFAERNRGGFDEVLAVTDDLDQMIKEHGKTEGFAGMILQATLNPPKPEHDAYLFTFYCGKYVKPEMLYRWDDLILRPDEDSK